MRSPAHGKPGIANLSPIGEREITEVLDQVSRTLHGRQTRSRNRPARGLDGRTLALLVPWWANELIGNPLSTTRCRELQIVQAHLLAFIHVHDALLDRIVDAFDLVLQLVDDLHDVRDGAASGQINAVLAASGGTSLSLRDLAPGVLRVCSLAQERLSWIETHSRPTSTLRRTCAYLSDCVRKAAVPSRQMEQARLLTRSLRQVVDSISLAAARPAELARAARVRG